MPQAVVKQMQKLIYSHMYKLGVYITMKENRINRWRHYLHHDSVAKLKPHKYGKCFTNIWEMQNKKLPASARLMESLELAYNIFILILVWSGILGQGENSDWMILQKKKCGSIENSMNENGLGKQLASVKAIHYLIIVYTWNHCKRSWNLHITMP